MLSFLVFLYRDWLLQYYIMEIVKGNEHGIRMLRKSNIFKCFEIHKIQHYSTMPMYRYILPYTMDKLYDFKMTLLLGYHYCQGNIFLKYKMYFRAKTRTGNFLENLDKTMTWEWRRYIWKVYVVKGKYYHSIRLDLESWMFKLSHLRWDTVGNLYWIWN